MSKSHIYPLLNFLAGKRRNLVGVLMAFLICAPSVSYAAGSEEGESLDVKGIIFEHLGDGYGWEVPFSHTDRIPLPVIVRSEDHNWFCFSSAGLTDKTETIDHETGERHHGLEPIVKTIVRDGKTYRFLIAHVRPMKKILRPNWRMSERPEMWISEHRLSTDMYIMTASTTESTGRSTYRSQKMWRLSLSLSYW